MKRTAIFTCHPALLWQEAQTLCGIFTRGSGSAYTPMLVETTNTAQLLDALEQELPNYDLFALAVQPAMFHELKAQLMLCLGFVCEERPEITQLQQEPLAMEEDAMFPAEARVFLTQNACFNGYALRSGQQGLLVLPLEADLLWQIDPQLQEYLETLTPTTSAVQSAEDPPFSELDMQLMRLGERYASSIDPIDPASIISAEEPVLTEEEPVIPAEEEPTVEEPIEAPEAAAAEPAPETHLAPILLMPQLTGEIRIDEIQKLVVEAEEPTESAELTNAVIAEEEPAITAKSENRNKGRTRALVAASLAICSLAASLFLTFYYNNKAEQPEINGHEVAAALASDYLQLNGDTLEVAVAEATVYEPESAYDAAMVNGVVRDVANGVALRAKEYIKEQMLRFVEMAKQLLPVNGGSSTPTPTPTPAPTPSPTPTPVPAAKGTFYFDVKGFGHGVGLSQEGARELARQGWKYDQIIKHYYDAPGISIKKESAPRTITHAGKAYSTKEYIIRIALGEIGGPSQTADEAIKTQMICAYTIAKRSGFKTTETNQHLQPDSQWNSAYTKKQKDKLNNLANEVIGRYVAYNNGAANALVFASCSGYTTSAKYAWGGYEPEPYLKGGSSSPETVSRTNFTLTKADVQAMVKTYNSNNPKNKITLGSDASQWIKILNTDAHGYVEKVRIGDRTLTGGHARLYFFTATRLRSHNFTVKYQ